MYLSFQFFSQVGNRTFVSTISWPSIVGNLCVVSIRFSNGKSQHCFNNFLSSIVGNLSVALILFSNGKSNCCFNTFVALHCKQSIRFLIFFFANGKSNLWFNNFLAFHCRQSICCFNSFLKWEIVPLLQQLLALHCKQSIRCFNSFVR